MCVKRLHLALVCEQPRGCCAKRADANGGYLGCRGPDLGEQLRNCTCYELHIEGFCTESCPI